jgi:6-phosphofructokinase 1
MQQGGNPSPFDRIQATRLASKCIEFLSQEADKVNPSAVAIGLQGGQINFVDLQDLPRLVEPGVRRPKNQWWLGLRTIATIMAQPGPQEVL